MWNLSFLHLSLGLTLRLLQCAARVLACDATPSLALPAESSGENEALGTPNRTRTAPGRPAAKVCTAKVKDKDKDVASKLLQVGLKAHPET